MSKPKAPEPAKLFLSAIYADAAAAGACLQEMLTRYGAADYSTRELPFVATHYYETEMGAPLWRRFFTFTKLLDPGRLPELKLFTNSLEQSTAVAGKRLVNLDPGLISLHNLILATGKVVAHRPYLGSGIYADLTLIYENGAFKTLPWTYPDYADPEMLAFLSRIRDAYKSDLRDWREEEKITKDIQDTQDQKKSP